VLSLFFSTQALAHDRTGVALSALTNEWVHVLVYRILSYEEERARRHEKIFVPKGAER